MDQGFRRKDMKVAFYMSINVQFSNKRAAGNFPGGPESQPRGELPTALWFGGLSHINPRQPGTVG
jgi:hypothetical protein